MSHILHTLFRYQSWANEAFFEKLALMDQDRQATSYHQALRLMNHAYVVAEIFAAHLDGRVHGYAADSTSEIPDMPNLRAAVAVCDRWYLGYVQDLASVQLAEKFAFSFTDGDKGYMSREEMLMHVVLHGGYHRGEVGRILSQVSVETPWDTFAVCLHRTEPARRQQEGRLSNPVPFHRGVPAHI